MKARFTGAVLLAFMPLFWVQPAAAEDIWWAQQNWEGDTVVIVAPEGWQFYSFRGWYGSPDDPNCGADVSAIMSEVFVGQTAGTIVLDNGTFGDPCGGVYKVTRFTWSIIPLPVIVPPQPSPEPSLIPVEPSPTPVEPLPEPITPSPSPEPSTPVLEPQPTPAPVSPPAPEPAPEPAPTPAPAPEPTAEPAPEPPTSPVEAPAPPPIEPEPPVIEPAPEAVPEPAPAEVMAQLAAEAQADDPVLPEAFAAIPLLGDAAAAVLEAFNALGNVGADMTPEVRATSEKVVVASVIVGQIATVASGAAVSAASVRRKE